MPPASWATAEAYARPAEALPGLSATEPAHAEPFPVGAGRVRAAQPAEGGPALETFLSRDDEQVVRDHGHRTRPEVIASFGLHRHSWPPCLPITAPWFPHRRVPRSPATHVSHDRTGGGMRMAVRPQASFAFRDLAGPGGACLPTRDRASCRLFSTVPRGRLRRLSAHLRRRPRHQTHCCRRRLSTPQTPATTPPPTRRRRTSRKITRTGPPLGYKRFTTFSLATGTFR
ncbi:hypothetical protein QF032_006034 [Streptomyces achromogenes]|nr:hypothetical protein [Streptomyces achromogenes]